MRETHPNIIHHHFIKSNRTKRAFDDISDGASGQNYKT